MLGRLSTSETQRRSEKDGCVPMVMRGPKGVVLGACGAADDHHAAGQAVAGIQVGAPSVL